MVRWTRFTVVALAMACAEPTRPGTPVGLWTLVGVDGSPIPATIVRNVHVVSGSLELRADGSYEELTETRIAETTLHSRVRGAWREDNGIVALLDRTMGLPFAGRWNGSSLEVKGERVMKYAR